MHSTVKLSLGEFQLVALTRALRGLRAIGRQAEIVGGEVKFEKRELSPLLDFSKQSSTVNWVDTLPPEFKQGVEDHEAVVGMDEDTVIAALGHPDRKVRSRDANGNDTEDWIYGHPPEKTVFVHFTGDHVTVIKQYPE